MTITFIDSGVLVTASRGVENLSDKAIKILSSADREFASSEFIKLEILHTNNINFSFSKIIS